MLAGLPITERVLDVGGVETTVLEAGDGPPLVLLHGGIECGGAYWAPVIARLAETPPARRARRARARRVRTRRAARRRHVRATGSTGVLEQTHAEQPTLVAHSLLGSTRRPLRRPARRPPAAARDLRRAWRRPVPHADAPSIRGDPVRHPSDRTQRRAVRPLRAPRPRRQRRRDPEWFEAFDAYGASQRPRPTREADDAQADLGRDQADPRRPSSVASRCRRRCSGVATTGWSRWALRKARAERLGWPLHVIDDAAHAPHMEQPEAFVDDACPPIVRTASSEQERSDHARLDGPLGDLEPHLTAHGRCVRATRAGTTPCSSGTAMVAKIPALVVQPESARDVAAAVAFARDHGLLLSVKGGGHNIAGHRHRRRRPHARHVPHARCHRRRRREARPRRGRDASCRTSTARRRSTGWRPCSASCPRSASRGLTLGGGFGYLARRFGWTVDNLEEVEIVTADGEIRTANRDENADLFWAVRGGGGNFGVVTRFTFRLHEVGPTVFGGLIAWPFERADEVLAAYRTLTAEAPRELRRVARAHARRRRRSCPRSGTASGRA